jgi:hypothetical protein
MNRYLALLPRIGVAAALAVTGYVHADLYRHGYRVIHVVGPGFLLLAAGCFALAVLLLIGWPVVLRLGAAALAGGALVGFAASRTVGVFGFTERGLQPAPQALLSLVAEVAVLALLVVDRTVRPGLARRPSVQASRAAEQAAGRPQL